MSGDGVSLQTNLVQLGNVAKTTARSNQAQPAGTPANEPHERREVAKLHRVPEAEKAQHQSVDPDRKRDRDQRHDRPDQSPLHTESAVPPAAEEPATDEVPPGVGGLIDTKA